MPVLQNKIDTILKKKNISRYKLNKMINYYESDLNKMIKGQKPFPDHIINQILPILEVSREEFESWILADKYPKEVLELAIKAKKENPPCNTKLILTTQIDQILQVKGLSRTALSKQIKHSQSSLNNAITGKEPLSKNLMNKISAALEISVECLQAWILADKCSLKILELAFLEF